MKTLAESYAEEILASHRGGPIHLMGYSAGGWYAYAVAEALLERQALIGLVAILDTHANIRIPRHLGLHLFSRMMSARLPNHLENVLQPPKGENRRQSLHKLLATIYSAAGIYLLGRQLPGLRTLWRHLRGTDPVSTEPYVRLLSEGYRPPRLPLTVHLFAPKGHLPELSRLWHFYAKGGVQCTPLFDTHGDFIKPELAPHLAQALETTLQLIEQRQVDNRPLTSP
jgi:thioesterase domain-containing protein